MTNCLHYVHHYHHRRFEALQSVVDHSFRSLATACQFSSHPLPPHQSVFVIIHFFSSSHSNIHYLLLFIVAVCP